MNDDGLPKVYGENGQEIPRHAAPNVQPHGGLEGEIGMTGGLGVRKFRNGVPVEPDYTIQAGPASATTKRQLRARKHGDWLWKFLNRFPGLFNGGYKKK